MLTNKLLLLMIAAIAFDGDGDGGGGGGGDADGGDGKPGKPTPGGKGGGKPPRTFTQEEVNAISERRAQQERRQSEQRLADFRKQHGLTNDDELKQWNEWKAERQTLEERHAEQLGKVTAEKTQAETERDALKARVRRATVDSAVEAAATSAKNPNRVRSQHLGQVKTLLRDRVQVDDDGKTLHVLDGAGEVIPGKKVGDFVTEWLGENPHFVQSGGGKGGAGSHVRNAAGKKAGGNAGANPMKTTAQVNRAYMDSIRPPES